jgi:hypothetical protein
MISYPAPALRRSVHRRFFFFLAKGLPPGAGSMFTGQTDEESFFGCGLLIHAPIGVFFSGSHGFEPWFVRARFVK